MGQAITDYVKFLADARDAVDCLGCDQATRDQMAAEEKRLERELNAARKSVADTISQTTKKRMDDISVSYDKEIGRGQERLKRARAKREKAKNRGMKERIADETAELREHSRELKLQMKTLFQQNRVPSFCNSTLYYALYYPRGLKEFLILLISVLICFLGIPNGIYFLIPKRQIWYLVAIYFIDVVLFGGLYVAVSNRTKVHHQDSLKKGRAIRNTLRSNNKKIRVITRTIQKDGNEDIYDLEKYDDEIACIEQELAEITTRKKEAINTFENVTKSIIADEIMENNRGRLEELTEQLHEAQTSLKELDIKVKDQNIHITDTYGPYLGQEFLQPERLSELSKLIQSGSATNITEAIDLFRKSRQASN